MLTPPPPPPPCPSSANAPRGGSGCGRSADSRSGGGGAAAAAGAGAGASRVAVMLLLLLLVVVAGAGSRPTREASSRKQVSSSCTLHSSLRGRLPRRHRSRRLLRFAESSRIRLSREQRSLCCGRACGMSPPCRGGAPPRSHRPAACPRLTLAQDPACPRPPRPTHKKSRLATPRSRTPQSCRGSCLPTHKYELLPMSESHLPDHDAHAREEPLHHAPLTSRGCLPTPTTPHSQEEPLDHAHSQEEPRPQHSQDPGPTTPHSQKEPLDHAHDAVHHVGPVQRGVGRPAELNVKVHVRRHVGRDDLRDAAQHSGAAQPCDLQPRRQTIKTPGNGSCRT